MHFFGKIIEILDSKMEKPVLYGWFHLLFFALAIIAGLEESFNMFYISPHQPPHLPVYSLVQEHVFFPLCTVIYIGAFTLASYIILLVAMLIKKCRKVR